MKNQSRVTEPKGKGRRVAISLEMDWGFKRHLEIYAGCQRYADEQGWECTINPAIDRVLLQDNGNCDGVLARVTKPMAEAALKANVPVVNVWLNSPVSHKVAGVFGDFHESGAMAARHLLGRGFRRFAYLGYKREIDSKQQLKGFRDWTHRAGYQTTSYFFLRTSMEGKASGWEKFRSGLEAWVKSWELPIGVLVTNDLYCRYLIDICRSLNLSVSQQVAIVGTYNETEICNSPSPTLTSIDMGMDLVGYRAAAMLDRLMDGDPPPESPELVVPSELISRQSTDSLAVDDVLVTRALRFMSENAHKRMKVKDVAETVGTTRRTLERRFRETLGRTIADEFSRFRLERAKRRMIETDAPMKEVAFDAGFRTADHFYKVFTRIEGVPPSHYRADHQKIFPRLDDENTKGPPL